jgi:hypothetical protein
MTNIHLSWLTALASSVLMLATNSWAQQRPPIFEKFAKTYGLDSWDKITSATRGAIRTNESTGRYLRITSFLLSQKRN